MKKTAALLIDATAWGFTMCALWALLKPSPPRPRVLVVYVDRDSIREADMPATAEMFSKRKPRDTATG